MDTGEPKAPREQSATLNRRDLPTTREIAESGVLAFERVARSFDPDTRARFVRDPFVRQCFVGVHPVRDITNFANVANNINTMGSPDFAVVPVSSRWENTEFEQASVEEATPMLVNLRAAERIIAYSPLFPSEAKKDPRGWFLTNVTDWYDSPEMTGALSGYAPWDVALWEAFSTARDKLYETDLPKDDMEYVRNGVRKDVAEGKGTEKAAEILARLPEGLLTPLEIGLLLRQRTVEMGITHFVSFHKSKDTVYCKELMHLYRESGIDEKANELTGELKVE